MKYLKWAMALPTLVFPYWMLLIFVPIAWPPMFGWWFWLATLVIDLAFFAMSCMGKWVARELAFLGLVIKLVHIPMYVLCFLFGIVAIPFGGPVIAFFWDMMTILLSGIVGLAAVLQSRREGTLSTGWAVVHGILQFVFCADIISAIIVYLTARQKREELL